MNLFPKNRCALCLAIVAVFVLGGCSLLRVPELPPPRTPEDPQWSSEALAEHLEFFFQQEGARATGTAGFAEAAAYASARLRESLVQPAIGAQYRHRYEAPPIRLAVGRMRPAGADTTRFILGRDYLPDPRTGAGTVEVREVLPLGGVPDSVALIDIEGRTVVVESRKATDELYERLAGAGAASVWSVGGLTAAPAREAIGEMAAFQITTAATANVLGLPLTALSDALASPEPRPLRVPIALEAVQRLLPPVDALNVMGYVAGQNPLTMNRLVIVCADLDDLGNIAGVRAADGLRSALGAAAVLELARGYSDFSKRTLTPQRTVLFALFSGKHQGYAGLQAYLRQPLWALGETAEIIYLGAPESDRDDIDALAAVAGISVTHVGLSEADEAAFTQRILPMSATPSASESVEAATPAALALLQAAHTALLEAADAP